MSRCRDCDGNRFRSVPILVRYKNNSMTVLGHRRLDTLPIAELEALQERLVEAGTKNQIILTAAVPCHCSRDPDAAASPQDEFPFQAP